MSASFRPPAERKGYPAPPDLAAQRKGMADAIAGGNWRTEPTGREDTMGGVRVLRFAPPGQACGVVVHMHGGGFRIGAPELSGPFALALAKRCGVEVICVNYRLAPDFPFPAGLLDARAVMHAAAKMGLPLIVSGDSAGGGLAASLASFALADGVRLAGAVLLSAWLDLTVTSPCYEANAALDPLFSRASAEMAAGLYLQGASPNDPLISPVFAPVQDFPPTLISVGTGEVLADDSRTLYQRLVAAGRQARLSAIDGMEHVAVTRNMNGVGAQETFAEVAAFIDAHLSA